MKNIYARDFMRHADNVLDMLSRIILIEGADNAHLFTVTMLGYILKMGEISHPDNFLSKVYEKLPKRLGDDFMTGAERLIQQGRQEGRQEGCQFGMCSILLDQLECKFGKVPSTYQNTIKNADPAQLSVWSKKILTAKTLRQIFAEELVN